MSDDELLFRCQWCSAEFPPDPDTMVEMHVAPVFIDEVAADSVIAECLAWSREELASMGDYQLGEAGLSTAQRDALLRGETVVIGMCICHDCQNDCLPAPRTATP